MNPQTISRQSGSMTHPLGSAAAELNNALAELAQLTVQAIAYLAGMARALVDRRPAEPRRRARRVVEPRMSYRPVKAPPPEALPLLTEAIVGSSKFTIARVLGAPRSAIADGVASLEGDENPGFFQADTWYYPLPRHGQLAMAVTFAGDVARRVQFFGAPGIERPASASRSAA